MNTKISAPFSKKIRLVTLTFERGGHLISRVKNNAKPGPSRSFEMLSKKRENGIAL